MTVKPLGLTVKPIRLDNINGHVKSRGFTVKPRGFIFNHSRGFKCREIVREIVDRKERRPTKCAAIVATIKILPILPILFDTVRY